VIVLDNLVTGKRENVNPEAKFYEINIADPQVKSIFEAERPEIVYDFAFNVLVPKSVEDPLVDMDSIIGGVNLLKGAKEVGIKKFLFSSSGFVYGNTKKLPANESEPIDPISPYVVSKNAVENYIKFFNKAYDLPYVIFRYAAVYGPGQVTGAMSDYIRTLSRGDQAKIWGAGKKTRDYVYIDDVVSANILSLDLPAEFKDPVFNVGTGKETTLNELYETVARLLNKEAKPVYLPDRPGEQIRYSLDASKINKTIGWMAKYNLEAGLVARLKIEGYL
jgi:UDP-glucose 4-epimerase